jgi:hypothetical protein
VQQRDTLQLEAQQQAAQQRELSAEALANATEADRLQQWAQDLQTAQDAVQAREVAAAVREQQLVAETAAMQQAKEQLRAQQAEVQVCVGFWWSVLL